MAVRYQEASILSDLLNKDIRIIYSDGSTVETHLIRYELDLNHAVTVLHTSTHGYVNFAHVRLVRELMKL